MKMENWMQKSLSASERLEELEENLWSAGWQKMNVNIQREAVHDSGKIGAGTLQKAQ